MIYKNNYIIYGRVQGVGFRRFAQRCAYEYSIGGYVRNLPDGNVEIEAIGELSQLQGFIEKINQGSWFSSVEEIENTSSTKTDSKEKDFYIIR